ncbi:hypothetical protein P1J78_15130 [Psychromarinibacter sp. C21-152]|uniref:DUF2783 domain-containing protein n=1 Tax=Psychromarinibacter sediminicola TaxID=3033385 RepID=A0AAE3NTD8_9RHOB|nr:hypothetical protein [Psychromarinibacter sediminicola]MDF0602074.1 hypothetical protein [Psychromarinibacter sediminicola]
MTPAEVETIYEALATRLDNVADAKREVFLAKLALLLANDLGQVEGVLTRIEEASRNLDI